MRRTIDSFNLMVQCAQCPLVYDLNEQINGCKCGSLDILLSKENITESINIYEAVKKKHSFSLDLMKKANYYNEREDSQRFYNDTLLTNIGTVAAGIPGEAIQAGQPVGSFTQATSPIYDIADSGGSGGWEITQPRPRGRRRTDRTNNFMETASASETTVVNSATLRRAYETLMDSNGSANTEL